ncbi:MAG: ATP-binding cassette domain-containing protein [Flavobacteriaceae bacterium]|nr:ATP-binding cassette domain-containing protein [Flavobacteriaceae bacterium]
MKKPIIDLKKINISIDNKNILSDVSFLMRNGEFMYLIGKTGSGKSSLLKILYGDIKINDGTGEVVGMDILNIKEKNIPFLRRKLGVVFQDFKLLPDRSIEKNLEFVLKATDWRDKKKISDRISKVLEKVKLSETLKKFPHELSGGEQQRVAIARAILNDPELILADEPTGNLDPATSVEIMEVLKEINNNGTTILIATHDYDIISKFPAKTLRIEDGKFYQLQEKK